MTINTQREERGREIKGISLERERHSCQIQGSKTKQNSKNIGLNRKEN